MRKQLIALAIALALTAILIACGYSTGTTGYVEPAMEGFTIAETTSELSTETALQAAESESAAQTKAATSFSAGTTTTAATTTITARPVTTAKATTSATTTTRPATAATTTTTRSTITTTTAAPKPQTQPPKPIYTEADYAEIIAAVRAYADSKTKVKFVWDTSLTMGKASYHDVPNLTRYGKASVLDDLKYHCDLTEDNLSGGNGGVPSSEVHYNVYWFVDQNNVWGFGNCDICFVLVYG